MFTDLSKIVTKLQNNQDWKGTDSYWDISFGNWYIWNCDSSDDNGDGDGRLIVYKSVFWKIWQNLSFGNLRGANETKSGTILYIGTNDEICQSRNAIDSY